MGVFSVHHGFVSSLSATPQSTDFSLLCKISSSAIYTLENKGIMTVMPVRSSWSRFSISCAAQFRPCIDIHKGKVKQIVGSTLQDLKDGGSDLVTNFESDKSASEFADLYKKDGLTGGHVIMLGADPRSRAAATEALRAYPGKESLEHLFLHGALAMDLWSFFTTNVGVFWISPPDFGTLIRLWKHVRWKSKAANMLWEILPLVIPWCLWMEQNNRIFRSKWQWNQRFHQEVVCLWWNWARAGGIPTPPLDCFVFGQNNNFV